VAKKWRDKEPVLEILVNTLQRTLGMRFVLLILTVLVSLML